MKKLILAIVAIVIATASANATKRIDSDGNTVYHHFIVPLQYQMQTFDFPKESSLYGTGLVLTSISHWGKFHVGANVNLSINAGIVDDSGMIVDFGPSARYDLVDKRLFINMPVNVTCGCYWPEGTTDTQTSWGMRITPSLYAFITDHIGIFAGPQVIFDFSSGSKASFGMQAGVAISF